MASSQSIVDFISEQMGSAGFITSRKMFGEYALYCNGKVIALICDDALFIKPTKEAKEFFVDAEDAPPYPGAKMYMLIPEDKWDDTEFMGKLASITYNFCPVIKPKKSKR